MKKILIGALIVIFAMSITLPLYADSGNKIVAKYDLTGTYQNHPGYYWGDVSDDAIWDFKIHIKVAEDPTKSTGMVKFNTDGVTLVGHVEEVKENYYWGGTNIAAVGWANYDGEKYYFMLLYKASAVWFCLSDLPYDLIWNSGGIYQGAQRVYQTHSLNTPPGITTLDFGVNPCS